LRTSPPKLGGEKEGVFLFKKKRSVAPQYVLVGSRAPFGVVVSPNIVREFYFAYTGLHKRNQCRKQ
jgi:hypothetical protein